MALRLPYQRVCDLPQRAAMALKLRLSWYSFIFNMYVRCFRERLGYGGDAHTHMEFALATYPSLAFYSKWARDWRDTQVRN